MKGSGLKRPLVEMICKEVDALYERDVQALRELQDVMFEASAGRIHDLSYCCSCFIPFINNPHFILTHMGVFEPTKCAGCVKMLQCHRPFCAEDTYQGIFCQGKNCTRSFCDDSCATKCQICKYVVCNRCRIVCDKCERIYCYKHPYTKCEYCYKYLCDKCKCGCKIKKI